MFSIIWEKMLKESCPISVWKFTLFPINSILHLSKPHLWPHIHFSNILNSFLLKSLSTTYNHLLLSTLDSDYIYSISLYYMVASSILSFFFFFETESRSCIARLSAVVQSRLCHLRPRGSPFSCPPASRAGTTKAPATTPNFFFFFFFLVETEFHHVVG